MKKFISKNWKKILIAIGICILIYILILKISAPKTLIADYAKYGKDIVSSNNISGDISGDISGIVNAGTNSFSNWFNTNPDLARLAIILMAGILGVVLLTSIASVAGTKKDDKKKK